MASTINTSRKSVDKTSTNGEAMNKKRHLSANSATARFWRSNAPKNITGDDREAVWSRHLAKRSRPLSLEKLCDATDSPLSWGLTLAELSPRTVELLAFASQLAKKKSGVSDEIIEQVLAGWLEGSHELPQPASQSVDFALECLVVAHALPQIADAVLPKFWWALLDALWQIVQSASDWRIDAELPAEQGLTQQLLAGELPLTLAYLLPEMRLVSKLRTSASEALSEGLAELTNGNGLLQGGYLGYQRPLVACWTRCQAMGKQLKKGCWNRKTQEFYQWAVTHSLGLSSSQGTPLLGQPHGEAWTADFLRTALAVGGDSADATAARSIFGKKLSQAIQGKTEDFELETSENCEWAGVAYMRTAWDRKAPMLAVDYSTPDLRLECWSGAQRLLAGTWSWETTLNGKRLEPTGSWDETCWFSDDDVDYLELSIDLEGGALLERQILLARNEMFLLLADYVIDTRGGKLCHRYRLPLESGVEFEPENETREGLLTAGKTIARVLPLALPEWRSDPRVGKLTSDNGRLQLEQHHEGLNMACPLLIDLNKSRAKKDCTWRQLTVAQSLEVQSHDVAVGFRAQCGKQQWLIYRSLVEAANRTLLGQNLSAECLVARFLAPSGEIDELLEIE